MLFSQPLSKDKTLMIKNVVDYQCVCDRSFLRKLREMVMAVKSYLSFLA